MIPDRHHARLRKPELGLGLGLTLGGNGLPSFGLNFTTGTTLDSRITFTRASTETYVGSNGLIQSAAIDTPAFACNALTPFAQLGIQNYPQRTSFILHSQQFENADWTTTAGTMTANQTNAPDGTLTADLFSEDNTSASNHGPNQLSLSLAASTTYTASVDLKYIGRQWVRFALADGGSAIAGNVWFDIQNGVVGSHSFPTGTFVSASIVQMANGFYRCIATFTTAAASSSLVQWRIWGASADNNAAAYVGINGATTYYWGAQLEAGTYASPYIPTVAAQVTRSTDSIAFTIPPGILHLLYTFDDASTQSVAVSAGAYTVPTSLNRNIIARISGLRT